MGGTSAKTRRKRQGRRAEHAPKRGGNGRNVCPNTGALLFRVSKKARGQLLRPVLNGAALTAAKSIKILAKQAIFTLKTFQFCVIARPHRGRGNLKAEGMESRNDTREHNAGRDMCNAQCKTRHATEQVADVGRFLNLAEKYSNLQEPDAVTVNELIQKIVVHSPEKIKGKKHVTLERYFAVGTIRIPLKKPNVFADAETPA